MNIIKVTKALYINSYKIQIEFSDNSSKIIDFEPFIFGNPHPQWEKYKEIKNFKKYKLENGNLVWGKNWDLVFPIYNLYTGNLLEHCS